MIKKDSVYRVLKACMESAEDYFHIKTIDQDGVKQPPFLYGEAKAHPEHWNYLDKRDFSEEDFKAILANSLTILDKELYAIIPNVALKATLDYTIWDFGNGKYNGKIDSNTYHALLNQFSKMVG